MNTFSIDLTTKLLRATFLNNMQAFQHVLPDLYQYFQAYQPSTTKLTIDHNNNVNLVDNGQLVYDGDPRALSIQQVEEYSKAPKCFSYGLSYSDHFHFEHEKALHKLTSRVASEIANGDDIQIEVPWRESQLDFVCMIGSGLGYQIEELFKQKDIRIFYLFEPSADVFFAAMHCIDFKPLIDRCKALGGSFTIGVGGGEASFVNQISKLFKANGYYLVSRIFTYRHYLSDENFNAFKLIHEVAHRFSAGWGFFEDEIISLIHTVENSECSYPILRSQTYCPKHLKNFPVVIVGNGPSLDDNLQLLKNRQENVIIVSCGTALKSLLANGITPNLHIEMERTALLDSLYELYSEQELSIVKTIPVLALNTVYSGLLNRFEKAYTMLKINDAGTDLLCTLSPNSQFQVVQYCNPTVSNAALMAMLHLGFEKIHFLGVDLGFVDTEHHHSKSSIYYEGDWEGQEGQHKRYKAGNMTTKGNFRDEVYTSSIFDTSRGVLEFGIQAFPNAEVLNCSDGVAIQGAEPLPFEELVPMKHKYNLKKELDKLLAKSFIPSEKDKSYIHNFLTTEFFPKFRIVLDTFIAFIDEPISNRVELSDMFARQHDYVYQLSARIETLLYFRFLKGSMIYFQSCIMSSCYKYTNEEMRMAFIVDGLRDMKEHFEFLFAELLKGYNAPAKV